MSTAATPSNDRIKSLTGTILLHATIIAMLALLKCGGGGGGNGGLGYTGLMSMDVAGLGNPVDGWGDPTPEPEEQVSTPVEETPVQDDNAISDDTPTENAPVVNTNKNDKPVTKPKDTTTKPKPAEEQQKLDNKLNNLLNNMGKSQGNTSGSGKQGTNDGQIDGTGVMSGGGSQGTGGGQGGGNGSGTGPGNGPGTGPGSGGGVTSWKLEGRSMSVKPNLSEKAPEEGTVVVDIWVDSNGNVTKAVQNVVKSSTTSSQLFELAIKAAKKAKFSASNIPEQKGTITIKFVLN